MCCPSYKLRQLSLASPGVDVGQTGDCGGLAVDNGGAGALEGRGWELQGRAVGAAGCHQCKALDLFHL